MKVHQLEALLQPLPLPLEIGRTEMRNHLLEVLQQLLLSQLERNRMLPNHSPREVLQQPPQPYQQKSRFAR